MAELSVQLKGLKEVDERLALLGAVAGEKVIRSTLFTAAKPIEEQAVANLAALPNTSGALAKATRRVYLGASKGGASTGSRFTVAVAPKLKDRTAIALANLFYKRKRPIRGIFWGHLVEWGHRIGNRSTGRLKRANTAGVLGKTKQHTGLGRVEGRKIFTRALQSRGAEAVQIFTKRIGRAVTRALKKQGLT